MGLIPNKLQYHLAWFFVAVLKSKDPFWLMMYKMKLRKQGYIDADVNPKIAAHNKAVVDILRKGLEEIRSEKNKE